MGVQRKLRMTVDAFLAWAEGRDGRYELVDGEVVSASSRSIDTNRKLTGYFRIPSVMHYLVVDPGGPLLVHHSREGAAGIAAASCRAAASISRRPA